MLRMLLLLLLSLPLAARCQSSSSAVSSVPTPVGSASHRGASLQVLEMSGLRFVEPFMALRTDVCVPGVFFDQLVVRYSLQLPLMLETVGLPGAAAFALTRLEPVLRGPSSSAVSVDCSLDRAGEATLTFWCDTFDRCQKLRWAAVSSQQALVAGVLFTAQGVVGQGTSVTLTGRRLQALPLPAAPGPCSSSDWVVFQQRVDGSLSFQQNWQTYVRGFGHPDSNYWMGLERLSAETLGSIGRNGHCALRVEVVDVYGASYWGENNYFQVYSERNAFTFSVTTTLRSGTLYHDIFYRHNGQRFYTYDVDTTSSSYCSGYSYGCSKNNGHGGWWYINSYFRFNLNALYTEKYVSSSQDGFNQVMLNTGSMRDVRTTKMMYKC